MEKKQILFPKHSLPHASKRRGDVREQEEPVLRAPPALGGGGGRSQRPSLSPPGANLQAFPPRGLEMSEFT